MHILKVVNIRHPFAHCYLGSWCFDIPKGILSPLKPHTIVYRGDKGKDAAGKKYAIFVNPRPFNK